jgi:hypothetical protein
MTTMQTDRLVDDYLSRLEEAAAHLQRSRRAELIAEIREHIEAALREEEAVGEVAVRNVLERLGPPEEIVEAAQPAPAAEQRPTGKLEVAAMVTLVVPFIGWLFGIAMVLQGVVEPREDHRNGARAACGGSLPHPRDRRQLLGEHEQHVRTALLCPVGDRRPAERPLPGLAATAS